MPKNLKTPVESKVQKYMWHGTTSQYLRSILKHGLLPMQKNVSLIQGVYLTVSLREAYAYSMHYISQSGNKNLLPIIILCMVSMDNQNISVDPIHFLRDIISDKTKGISQFFNANDPLPHKILQLTHFFKVYYPWLPENQLYKMLSIKQSVKNLFNAYKQFDDDEVYLKSNGEKGQHYPQYDEYADDENSGFEHYLLHEPDGETLIKALSKDLGSLSLFHNTSESTNKTSNGTTSLVVNQPITYRGSKRIVAIFQGTPTPEGRDTGFFKKVWNSSNNDYKEFFEESWDKSQGIHTHMKGKIDINDVIVL